MIEIDLSKQQVIDVDPRAILKIKFTTNLDKEGNTTMFFIIEEKKRNCFGFFTKNCKSFVKFNFYENEMTQYNSLNVRSSNSRLIN